MKGKNKKNKKGEKIPGNDLVDITCKSHSFILLNFYIIQSF